MNAAYINPFLVAATAVFDSMLGVHLERQKPYVRNTFDAQHEVTGVIGLTGRATGTVAFSLPAEVAFAITERLLGERPSALSPQVTDAMGEVTNMIAGAAKAELADLKLSLGLPTVVIGKACCIAFPTRAVPISIPFLCELGPFVVEVGIVG
jgi:chemotaxis protein CheX